MGYLGKLNQMISLVQKTLVIKRSLSLLIKKLLFLDACSGEVDIAVMQSLSKREDIHEILDSYGQIIIDECHHISAFSFEAILKQAKAKYILGLTATPVRRDGHQPIIFMQCGPIRHTAAQPKNLPTELEVWPQYIPCTSMSTSMPKSRMSLRHCQRR